MVYSHKRNRHDVPRFFPQILLAFFWMLIVFIGRKEIFIDVLNNFKWPSLIATVITIIYILFFRGGCQAYWISLIKDFFAAFITSLFFIMYFNSQYRRSEKHTDDKERFATIIELIHSLRSEQSATVIANHYLADSSIKLITEAKKIRADGYTLAAFLQAGVAFEQAITKLYNRYNSNNKNYVPLLKMINFVENKLPQGFVGEFHALRQIRNRVVHLSEEEINDLPDVDRILKNYEWAIFITCDLINANQEIEE